MIHSMWATFYAAALPIVYEQEDLRDDESYSVMADRVARGSAILADRSCAEYDKRDKAATGSPYRG